MTHAPEPATHQSGSRPSTRASDDPDADETLVTDITIQPDGRVYVFGTSRPVLEVLEMLNPGDPRLQQLLSHIRACETPGDRST